ncbi:hypothetical protein [Urbifossiella limnaea]|uniref:Uncharacterized protein n=1 Tax=Urbifossiella limnaea TaxID=2528023 RepID=A0A517XPX5_9BACT|nr:hypothetical protein [Urbifossiella limnaea]QDU19557.1 hypothetical protein ETAA1_14860 [Urbifossiella limnaea]
MRLIRSRDWLAAAVGVVALGCGREAPSPAVAVAEPAVAPVAPAPAAVAAQAPQPPAPLPQPPAPPPVFPFPTDTAGKELPKVVAPQPPAPLPVDRFGAAPKERAPAAAVRPDSLGKLAAVPPPALPKRPAGFAPHAPAERVPLDLGVGADAVPARPSFAVPPVEVVRAPDVTQPPPLASLARQVPDRASLDDPSAEPAGAVIVNRVVNPAVVRAEFWRMVLPDPFELAAQVRPVVPPAADPGLTPVTVNPMRPR